MKYFIFKSTDMFTYSLNQLGARIDRYIRYFTAFHNHSCILVVNALVTFERFSTTLSIFRTSSILQSLEFSVINSLIYPIIEKLIYLFLPRKKNSVNQSGIGEPTVPVTRANSEGDHV